MIGSPEFVCAYEEALAAAQEAHINAEASATRQKRKEPPSYKAGPGVYLLLKQHSIIYIGTSQNMRKRVLAHQSNGREFDKVYYIPTPHGDRERLEKALIKVLRPKSNKVGITKTSAPEVANDLGFG